LNTNNTDKEGKVVVPDWSRIWWAKYFYFLSKIKSERIIVSIQRYFHINFGMLGKKIGGHWKDAVRVALTPKVARNKLYLKILELYFAAEERQKGDAEALTFHDAVAKGDGVNYDADALGRFCENCPRAGASEIFDEIKNISAYSRAFASWMDEALDDVKTRVEQAKFLATSRWEQQRQNMHAACDASHVNKFCDHAELELEKEKKKKEKKKGKSKLENFCEVWKSIKGEAIEFETLPLETQSFIKKYLEQFTDANQVARSVENETSANLEELIAKDKFFKNLTFKPPKNMKREMTDDRRNSTTKNTLA